MTGGNSGCGKETVRILASWNATVILACRDLDKVRLSWLFSVVHMQQPSELGDHVVDQGEAAAQDIRAELLAAGNTKGKVDVWELDLASLKSVRDFTREVLETSMPGRW